ncbi:PIG-L deacetylase family protein [Levilinea saccharolytica]|uniref:GlcNAc-PI de-N-acetylase n=1 Tax=Levilinea saccharolytica TaxID=229921 RepID=A0A0P6YIY9_9CHLR|nr:PIG-L deacetylase family protein [Levilinea saccharolytica]KPL85057.1 hypothetical protein ADN01_06690 [Levilinea saccharolytica]
MIESWECPQTILVVMAHPDDAEFYCGGTIARWTHEGHRVISCILTSGNRGTKRADADLEALKHTRQEEQRQAAELLGVESVIFYDYEDGYLRADAETRKTVVRVIRQVRPEVVVSLDPTLFFPERESVNHCDHRACGEICADAVYPAAFLPWYYPELRDEGCEPHRVRELWLAHTGAPNLRLDVSEWFDLRLEALLCHKSQYRDRERFIAAIAAERDGQGGYSEGFRRIQLEAAP